MRLLICNQKDDLAQHIIDLSRLREDIILRKAGPDAYIEINKRIDRAHATFKQHRQTCPRCSGVYAINTKPLSTSSVGA